MCVFEGIIPREKQQEIKTVRIVKRESERRQRDRDRVGSVGIPLLGSSASAAKRIGFSDDHLDSSLVRSCPLLLVYPRTVNIENLQKSRFSVKEREKKIKSLLKTFHFFVNF